MDRRWDILLMSLWVFRGPMKSLWMIILIIILSLYPLLPNLLNPVLPATSEVFRYMVLGEWFHRDWSIMNPYPRWLPEMNGGYGYPQFVFYQPAYFFVQAIVAAAIEDWMGRQLVTLSLLAILGGLGMYRLGRLWLQPVESLWLVGIFTLSPYSRINLFSRGDLSEWMCLIELPWALWALIRFVDSRSLDGGRSGIWWFILSLVIAILCYSHPVAVIFLPVVLGFLALSLISRPFSRGISWRILFEIMGSILMGLLLSAPYWATVVIMKPLVLSETTYADWTRAYENASPLWALLFGSFRTPQTFHETEFLGAPFVALAILGFWWGRKDAMIRMAGYLYVSSILLMMPIGSLFWHLHPFSLLQFPWRLALFAPLLQSLLARGLLLHLSFAPWRSVMMVGSLLVLIIWNLHSPNQFRPWEELGPLASKDYPCFLDFTRTARPGTYPSTLDTGEWLPKNPVPVKNLLARQAEDQDLDCDELRHRAGDLVQKIYNVNPFPGTEIKPLVESDAPGWHIEPLKPRPKAMMVSVNLEGTSDTQIVIHQLYLEGWRVFLNGVPLSKEVLLENRMEDGQIRFPLGPGRWQLEATYEGPLYGHHILLLMILGCLAGWGYWSLWASRGTGLRC